MSNRATFKAGLNLKPATAIPGAAGKAGSFLVGGITRADGGNVATLVFLTDMIRGQVIAEALSDASGEWEIKGLRLEAFYSARIVDQNRELNGAVLDWIKPVPM